ncbi:hypothetical protein V9789_004279 [Vibrio vulnificus]|nr:hypothetical protein [Vibrio vulnificus]ELP4436080.1 hypothetical protein [Vibrio vulnificus]
MRDDFSEITKRTLAERVGWICSYPECNQVTVGPHSDVTKRINIGHACHIEAAAPNGPRFNPLMTTEQRKSIENGIWMCRNHSGLIDSDSSIFSVEQLKTWKLDAEKRALRALGEARAPENVDLYVSNILAHRDRFSTLRDMNFFSLYWCNINHLYYLQGMGGFDIVIKDSIIEIEFLKDQGGHWFRTDFRYIDRVELPMSKLIDLVVSSHDHSESVLRFDVSLDFRRLHVNEVYFSIGSITENAHYGSSDYLMKNNTLYDDLNRRISPTFECIYLDIIQICFSFYRRIAP